MIKLASLAVRTVAADVMAVAELLYSCACFEGIIIGRGGLWNVRIQSVALIVKRYGAQCARRHTRAGVYLVGE